MQRRLDRFYHVTATSLGMLVLVMTFLIVIDVSGRYFANKPLIGAVDVSRLLLSFVLFWGFAYALHRGAHVRVTLLYKYLPHKKPLEIIVCVGGLLLIGFLTYSSWGFFWDSWIIRETMRAPVDLPRWLAKLALFCGALMFTVQFGIDLIGHIRKSDGGSIKS